MRPSRSLVWGGVVAALALGAALVPVDAVDRLRVTAPPAAGPVLLPEDRFGPSADNDPAGSVDDPAASVDDPAAAVDDPAAPRTDTPTMALECRADECTRWRLPPAPRGSGPPAVDPAGALVARSGDGLAAFETADGAVRWTAPLEHTGPEAVTFAAVKGAPSVLVAGPGERLRAFSIDDGALQWDIRLDGLAQLRQARATGAHWHVVSRFRDGPTTSIGVVQVDPADGTVRWRAEGGNATLTDARPVVQDTGGRLRGLDPRDGATVWEYDSRQPGARLTPLGDLLVLTGRAGGAVVDSRDGRLTEEFASPLAPPFVHDGALVWGSATGVEYLDGDGTRWSTAVAERRACCRGFTVSDTVVTTLGSGQLLQFDRNTGRELGRIPLTGELARTQGSALLYGPLVVVPVPGAPRGLAQVHEVTTGRHLADITRDAYALHAVDDGSWVLLAPDHVLALHPDGRPPTPR